MGDVRTVGIDPGLDGGLAIMNNNRLCGIKVMPTKPGAKGGRDIDAAALANILTSWAPIDKVAVEQVHAMKGQGVTSTFNFGKGYGKVLAVIEVLKIPMTSVTPQRWKKSILDGLGRDKNASIRFVQSAFPGVDFRATERCKVPHDGVAEATCLAEYARREVLGFAGPIVGACPQE